MYVMSYAPSGRFKPWALAVLPLLTALTSSVLAVGYVLAVWYCPIIYLSIALPILWGLGTFLGAWPVIKIYAVRNPALAKGLTFLGALAGYLFSWVVWSDLVINMGDWARLFGSGPRAFGYTQTSLDFGETIELLFNPDTVGFVIWEVLRTGLWTVGDHEVSGIILALVWLAEAGLFFGLPLHLAGLEAGAPYSEASGRWFKEHKLHRSALLPLEYGFIIEALKKANLGPLMTLPGEIAPKDDHLELSLHTSAHPTDYAFLTVKGFMARKTNKLKQETVAEYLAISPKQARELMERFDQPV